MVRSALVWVNTSRTNWVSASRVDLCLVTGRKSFGVSCPEVLAAVAFVIDLGLDAEVKIRVVTTLAEDVTSRPGANECTILPFGLVIGVSSSL